jgi:hypothetical protein
MSNTCDNCGTEDLPDGKSACCYGSDCLVCEDCMCKLCNSIESCEKHCRCEEEEYEDESSDSDD